MIYLLKLRLKQLYRALRDIGWLLLLLVAPMLIIFVLGLLEKIHYSGTPVLAMVVLALVFSTHAQRNDTGFLRLLNYAPNKVFLIEYSAAVLPFSILGMIALNDWLNPLMMQVGVMLIALFPAGIMQKLRPKAGANLAWFPTRFFELKCVLRQHFFLIALIYVLCLALCIFTGSMPIVAIILSIMASTAYDSIENRELLELTVVHENWLPKKALEQVKAFQLLMLPHYTLFLIIHFQYWYILAAIVLITSCLLIFAVSYKYAHYYPRRQKANNQMAVGLFMLFLMNPFFAPACLVYLWVYWRRAGKNMKLYY